MVQHLKEKEFKSYKISNLIQKYVPCKQFLKCIIFNLFLGKYNIRE